MEQAQPTKITLEKVTEEELLELKAAIEKKLASKDYPTIGSVLKVVSKKDVSYDLLKVTKIGKTLADLKNLDLS